MRIFNKENNQLVVYVQQKNIKAIIKHEDKAPKSLYKLAKSLKLSDMDETNDEEFIRITDKKTVEYMKRMHWIPDYRELRDLSDQELEQKVQERSAKIQEMSTYYLSLGPYDQRSNPQIPVEYAKINQTVKDINAYLWTRQGKYDTPITIPLMMDCMAGIMESNGTIKIGRSIDAKHILIANRNGGPCTSVNPIELQMGLMVYATEENLAPHEPGNFSIKIKRGPDNRFLVADYEFEKDPNYIAPQIEEQEPQQPHRIKPEQKKKSIFNRVFQPKKKDEN